MPNESPNTPSVQAQHNLSEWGQGKHLAMYDNLVLTPVEVNIFVRYRDQLSGRVLDLGCGAGRVLAHLAMIGADAYGIDLSPKMVERCRQHVPEASVQVGDVTALAELVDGPFDAIVAPDNLIDVFDDEERRAVLASIHGLLAPDGVFVFSTHDLAWADDNPGRREWEEPLTPKVVMRKLTEVAPADVVRSVHRRRAEARNRERLAPLQRRCDDYAIINDFPHDYSLLHYYIRRDDQERQLQDLGYELIDCLDSRGRNVGPGAHGDTDSLYYVARSAA